MTFFKIGKKKKEDNPYMPQEPIQPQQSSPVGQVIMMKQQGYTDNQIVQALQSQGYASGQIFDAISQAGMGQNMQAPPEQPEMGMPEFGQTYEQDYQQNPYPAFQTPKEVQPLVTIDDERIQEVAEAIIDEKWQELAKDIKKVIEWKERSESRIVRLEQQIIDMRLSMDALTKSMMGKISSYDQNIVDVGTEIKAMEKVFQKVLPSLTESVNKLDRMTKGYKEAERK